jgi:hypothetical protein
MYGIAFGDESCTVQRRPEHRQGPSERRPRLGVVRFGPQERGELLAANDAPLDGEVGEQSDGLARVDRHELASTLDARGAEKPDG